VCVVCVCVCVCVVCVSVCVILSVTSAVYIFVCAYYGWPAPMALAFRQPPLIFLLCVLLFVKSVYGK